MAPIPKPGAPGDLEVIRQLVNTYDLEDGTDRISTPAELHAFLEQHDLPAGRVTREDVERVAAVRGALRAVLLANNGFPLDPAALTVLEDAGRAAPLFVRFGADGTAALEPAASGVDAAIGRLLAIVERSQAEGTWERFKACSAHDCHWAFYDYSRNRSRTWCDMAVCGNRAKARTYRSRTSE